MASFRMQLQKGQLGESVIARWCMSRGNSVLPVYEKEIDTGKGPRFFTPKGQLVAPDMFIIPSMHWVEAKHKTVFTWYRKERTWCTGIDIHHFRDYVKVQETSTRPVWLLFLHRSSQPSQEDIAWGCPPSCPTGLFGNSLDYLAHHKSHDSGKWGRHGMIYWAVHHLRLLAPMEEIERIEVAA